MMIDISAAMNSKLLIKFCALCIAGFKLLQSDSGNRVANGSVRSALPNYRFGACDEVTVGNNQSSASFKLANAVPSIGSL